MEMLGAIVLVFALQKIAALLSIPVILGMIWVKGFCSLPLGTVSMIFFP